MFLIFALDYNIYIFLTYLPGIYIIDCDSQLHYKLTRPTVYIVRVSLEYMAQFGLQRKIGRFSRPAKPQALSILTPGEMLQE
jgi:hypothetical protein